MCEFSIIVPCYNVEPYLKSFMDSLSQQSFTDFEVLFVDDGSTDGTRLLLQEFEEKDDRIHLIRQKNQGVGMARNIGLVHARGNYVCFFDPDDIIKKDLLKENLSVLKEKKVDVCIFGIGYIDEEGKVLAKKTTLREKEKLFISSACSLKKNFDQLFYETSMFSPCNKIYSRQFLLDNQLVFPNNRTGQDSLFNIEVIKQVPVIYVTHHIYYYYRFNRKGSAARKLDKQRIKDDLAICHRFSQMINELGLSTTYSLNLNFQKFYKLVHRIKQEKENQQTLLAYLFDKKEFTSFFKFSRVNKINGKKNKFRFLYLLLSNYQLLKKGKL